MTIPVYFFNSLGYVILWTRDSRDFGFKSEIFQHYVGGDGTHRGDSSSRVAGRSGHVEVPDGGVIVSIAWKRSKVAALRQGALTSCRGTIDERKVVAGEAFGCVNVLPENVTLRHVGGVFLQLAQQHVLNVILLDVLPTLTIAQLIRNESVHDEGVFAIRRAGGVFRGPTRRPKKWIGRGDACGNFLILPVNVGH